jgi:hypothetical protein
MTNRTTRRWIAGAYLRGWISRRTYHHWRRNQ